MGLDGNDQGQMEELDDEEFDGWEWESRWTWEVEEILWREILLSFWFG